MFTHIYKYSVFVVSPWFQKEITWSPNWWLFPMLPRCWLLWWLWHHPWHHADAGTKQGWEDGSMEKQLYQQESTLWTAHGEKVQCFFKASAVCFFAFFLFGGSLWPLAWIPFRSMDSYTFTTFEPSEPPIQPLPKTWRFGIPQQWYGPWKKVTFPLNKWQICWISIISFHGGVLYRVSFGTRALTPPTFGCPGDSQLSSTGTFQVPKESFDASVDIGRHGGVGWVVMVWSIFAINREVFSVE